MPRITLFVLMSCIVVSVRAADPSATEWMQGSQSTTQLAEEVLDEVLVEGRRPITDTRKLTSWIDRLVGQFSYEGSVDRYNADGSVQRAIVSGGSQCVRFERAVAVQCQLNVTWRGVSDAAGQVGASEASPLAPAVVVYGLNHAQKSFGHLQVDRDGIATGGKGWLVDNTLISKDHCADFPDCLRVLRLEAPPDAKVIRMRVDLEQNGKLQVRQDFQWNRQSPVNAGSVSAAAAGVAAVPLPGTRMDGSAKVPSDIEAWLRRLPGQFRIPAIDDSSCWRIQTELAARAGVDARSERLNCRKSNDEKAQAKDRPADAECQNIGAGPGVRCVIYMPWPESGTAISRKWYQTLNPGFLMYGFDPVKRGIALVAIAPTSNVGPAGFTAGLLRNDKLNYIPDCSRPPCTAVEQMSIAPAGEWVLWQISHGSGKPTFMSWRMDRVQLKEVAGQGEAESRPRRSISSPRRP